MLHAGELDKIAARVAGDPNLGEGSTNNANDWSQARITPDGRRLLFGSRTNLTGYDPSKEKCAENRDTCNELYLYSYDSGELVCVSCDPSGAPPRGDAGFLNVFAAGGAWDPARGYENSPLSNDGRYVFFNSPDPLSERDSNGKLDVYAYDSEAGTLSLLSSGQCNCRSAFLTASPDGHDVFIVSRQQLVRADTGDLLDLYDVRIDGGIAAQQALPAVGCQGDACQPLRGGAGEPDAGERRLRRARERLGSSAGGSQLQGGPAAGARPSGPRQAAGRALASRVGQDEKQPSPAPPRAGAAQEGEADESGGQEM